MMVAGRLTGLRSRGRFRLRPVLHGVVLAAFFGSTSTIAFQDAAAMLAEETAGTDRWRATLIAPPHGSIHAATLSLPDTGLGRDFGVKVGADGSELMVAGESDGAPAATGAIPTRPLDFDSQRINRATKADLLMSRPRLAEPLVIDTGTGVLRRPARGLVDPSTQWSAPTSFLPARQVKDAVVMAGWGLAGPAADSVRLASVLDPPRPLVERAKLDRELSCLANAIYFEARGEPEEGQRAVAQVVLNRVRSGYYPDDICGVVYQNKHWRNRCQFSFACDRVPDRVRDSSAWDLAQRIAKESVNGESWVNDVGEATHYHATYVRPRWIREMRSVDRIGQHIFYIVPRWMTGS